MEENLNEILYNQKDICEELFNHGISEAMELISDKRQQIANLAKTENSLYLYTFLSSLNKSLYYYMLFNQTNTNEKCRYFELDYFFSGLNKDDFIDVAQRILLTYKKAPSTSSQNKYIDEACQYIHEHLDEELTLEKVSSNIFISRCHLCQLFRTCKSINFSEYVTDERVARAKILLSTKKISVDLVAEYCGFSSSSYFSTVFKKKVGFSPREYRKQYAKIA